ncbi:unnamed protein product [Mytilus coruscus]|uniref:C2H2-type domain-containing protein n=1 Tax=Mytilus coruscus TaxID=42192 RepID=A0A6J8ETB4_MYTCO|nr:unnamed protein product [Mytilus coruscus]
MSTEIPLNIMAEDENFDQEKFIGFYYSTDMHCPLADCDFGGRFSSKTKYSRHWEERHLSSVQKLECPIQYCRSRLRRRSNLKSHIKFVHGEKNDIRIEEIILKSKKVVEHSRNFINPGFFVFKGRTQKSVNSSTPTTSSSRVPKSTYAAVQASSAVVPSAMVISSVLTSTGDQDDNTV